LNGGHPVAVFVGFEASSLGREGFPIEVAWVFETGGEEAHPIRFAQGWTEWPASAEAVHPVPRDLLERATLGGSATYGWTRGAGLRCWKSHGRAPFFRRCRFDLIRRGSVVQRLETTAGKPRRLHG